MNDNKKKYMSRNVTPAGDGMDGIDFETAYSILFKVFLRSQFKTKTRKEAQEEGKT